MRPEDRPWSSTRLHLGRRKTDPPSSDQTVVEIVGDWRGFSREGVPEEDLALETQFLERLLDLSKRPLPPLRLDGRYALGYHQAIDSASCTLVQQ